MAKPIQPIDRQVATPNVAIKPSTVFSTLGQVTGEIGGALTEILGGQATYYSGLAGQEAALKGEAPKTLAPPLTKATAAYNQAVIDTEARQLTEQGREMIVQTYAELANPAKFKPSTPAEFAARAQGISQGILENARPENRGAIQAQLNTYISNAKVSMIDAAIDYDNKQTRASFNNDFTKAKDRLREAMLSELPPEIKNEQIKLAQKNIGDILADYSVINNDIMNEVPRLTAELNEQVKIDQVASDFLDSYRNGQEVKFIDGLTKRKPDNLTTVEYFKAMQQVLQLENTLKSSEQQYNTEQFYKAHYEIMTKQINTLDELKQEYGNKVPAAMFYSLSETLLARKKTVDSVYEVERVRRYGANEVSKLDNKVLNDYYIEKERQILADINSNLQPGQDAVNRLSLAQRAEYIILPAGAPIPNFLTDLSFSLKSTDPLVSQDAVNAYRLLFRNQGEYGDTLKGLDSDADDIAQYVLSLGDISEAQLPTLITTAQDNVNDKSDTTRVARRERLQKFYTLKDGVSAIQTTYKKTYGTLPNNENVDAHYGAFQKLFDNYFMGVANGSERVALAMTQNALRDWGTSRYGEKDKYMFAPPESTPYANVGYWMDNQHGEALNELLSQHEAKQSGLARPKWMADVKITNETTDQELLDKPYYPAKGAVLVNGIEREVFVQSTKNTRTSSYPGEVYQFYYKDDFGVPQYIMDPNNQLAAANWVVKPMFEFVPEAFNSLQDETIDQMARTTAIKENKGKDGAPEYTGNFEIDLAANALNVREPTEAELAAMKDRLKMVASKTIAFKDGKPVEADPTESAPKRYVPPLMRNDDKENRGGEIDLDKTGRRKKK